MATDIGARIRSLRTECGLSQEEVARRTGIGLKSYGDIERGRTKDPHYSTLRAVARALSVPVQELIEEPALAGKSEAPDTGLVGTDEEITFQLKSVDEVTDALHEVFSKYPPSQNKRIEMLLQDDGSVEVRIRPSESTKPTKQKGGRVGTFTKKRFTKKRART